MGHEMSGGVGHRGRPIEATRRGRGLALVVVTLPVVTAACGDAEGDRPDGGAASETTPSSEADGEPILAATTDSGTDSTDDADHDTAEGDDSTIGQVTGVPGALLPGAEVTRLAPSAAGPSGALWYWNQDLAGSFGHGTEWSTLLEGLLFEVAEVPLQGLVFQREGGRRDDLAGRLRRCPGADRGCRRSVPAPGGGGTGPGRTTARLLPALRTGVGRGHHGQSPGHDLSTGDVREILETGGWESGTQFGHLSGGIAPGRWSGEAYAALLAVDLATGDIVLDTRDEACGDAQPGCPVYQAATAAGDDLYGVRPIPDSGTVPSAGLFRYDPATGTDELIVEHPVGQRSRYVEDLFAGPGPSLTLSLQDGDGRPLPALTVEPSTGEAETSPLVALVRPAHLS